jgi:hypothetical protein
MVWNPKYWSYETEEGWESIPLPEKKWSEEERLEFAGGFNSFLRSPSNWDGAFSIDGAYGGCQYLVEDYIPRLNALIGNTSIPPAIKDFLKESRRIAYSYLLDCFSIAIESTGAVNWEYEDLEGNEFEDGKPQPRLLLDSRGE